MKRIGQLLLLPLGLVIYLAMLAYLAWEKRTSPWHRSRAMGAPQNRTAYNRNAKSAWLLHSTPHTNKGSDR